MKLLGFCLATCILLFATIFVSCESEQSIEYKKYYILGRNIYQTKCLNCHAENGEGLGTLIPPLKAADYLTKNKKNVACIIQNGQQGLIVVNGKFYNGKMPSQEQLSPIDIAEVMTYITNSFGNNQGIYHVEKVVEDLEGCK